MDENRSLVYGRRAGNVLLVKIIVVLILYFLATLLDDPSIASGADLIGMLIVFGIVIVLSFILIGPLKMDRLRGIRTVYILLACFSLLTLFFSFSPDYSSYSASEIMKSVIFILAAIGLFALGTTGGVLCFIAAGVAAIRVFVVLSEPGLTFPDLVASVFDVVFYIFLGLYVKSKGGPEPTPAEADAPPRETYGQPDSGGNGYDELVRLKQLMDSGVITPAEYEAKKKQILGL